MNKPVIERSVGGGTQKLYRFENGYGASVIKHEFSYGGQAGLWELVVLKYNGEGIDDWDITYETEITNDIIGWLSLEAVEDLLVRISNPDIGLWEDDEDE